MHRVKGCGALVALMASLVALLATSAGADESGDSTITGGSAQAGIVLDGRGFEIEGTRRSGVARGVEDSGGAGGVTPVGGGPDPEPRVDALEPSWGQQEETGEACIVLTPRAGVDPGSELGVAWDIATLEMMADPRLRGVEDFFCDPDMAAATPRPDAAANAFVRSVTLPSPGIRVDPGVALTGLPAYLVIDGQDDFTVAETVAGWGALSVSFEVVSFVVDWGDGTVEVVDDGRTGASHDGPPSAQISHVYDQRDPDSEVVVTSAWRAAWSVAGFAGVVEGLSVDAVLPLPVREYRAVRVASD